jgi:hypothetical protein
MLIVMGVSFIFCVSLFVKILLFLEVARGNFWSYFENAFWLINKQRPQLKNFLMPLFS